MCTRACLRRPSYVAAFLAALASSPLHGQSMADTLHAIVALDRLAATEAAALEREVWPGYRFDSLGLMYILPNVGKLALRWPGPPPNGMEPLPGVRGAVWSDTRSVRWGPGVAAATLPVSRGASPAEILGLALHEAFHAYQVTQRREGRRFGAGENSLVTATYPLFDVENEAAVAAESQLLRRAVAAGTEAEARRLAAEFVALRNARQARLDSAIVAYEKAAELHEGLPQYAMLRGLAVLAVRHPALRDGAEAELAREAAVLDSTLAHGQHSVRRRFYASGSHIAMLLDRLAGAGWKARLMRDDLWLQDLLAETVGGSRGGARALAAAEAFVPAAARAVAALRDRRQALRDSILSGEGTRLVIDVTGANWCFFDPQNVLTTGTGQLLHMRVLRLCLGDRMTAMFERPVVEDSWARLATTTSTAPLEVVAAGTSVQLPEPGEALIVEDVRIRGEGIDIALRKAALVVGRSRLMILPLAP